MVSIKQKGKHKFNTVDAVIIIVIATVIGTAVYLLWAKGLFLNDSESFEVEYVVEFRMVRDEFITNFKVGSKVVDSVAKYQIGEVVAVNTSVSAFTGTNTVEGKLVYFDYPEHSDVSLTVRSKAVLNDENMYTIDGGYRISVGSTMYIRMPDYTGQAYCTQIKKTEAK